MFRPRLFVCFALLISSVAVGQFGAFLPKEEMVPGALGARMDRLGLRWNVESNGAIGRSESGFLNSASALIIDGEAFQAQRLRMSPDAATLYLPGKRLAQYPDLTVFRQITVDDQKQGVHYTETFRNDGDVPLSFDAELKSQFSASMDSLQTDTGRDQPKLLQKGERGLVIKPKPSGGDHALLYTLTAPGSRFLPTISSPSVYSLSVITQIELEPGESKSFRHALSKAAIEASVSELDVEFSAITSHLFGDIDQVGSEVINQPTSLGGPQALSELYGGTLSFLSDEVAGLGASALLRLPDQSPIRGGLDTATLTMKHRLGTVETAVEDVIAFGHENDESWVLLADGQLIIGAMALDEKIFAAQNGVAPLALGKLDSFSVQLRPVGDWAQDGGIVELNDGSIFRVDELSPDKVIKASNSHGTFQIPGDVISSINRTKSGMDIAAGDFALARSSNIEGELDATISIFSQSVTFPISEVVSFHARASDSSLNSGDRVETKTGSSFRGTLETSKSETIAIGTSAGEVPVNADQVAEIRALGEEGGFELTLEDGTVLRGTLPQTEWRIQTDFGDAVVTASDVDRMVFAPKPLTAEETEQLNIYLTALADDNWENREVATEGLITMGRSARPALLAVLPELDDPEVRHRIERVLAADPLRNDR